MDQVLLTDLVSIFISQMDILAVRNATDDILKNLGLIKVGDRLSLRGFCDSHQTKENDGKRKKLLEAFYSSKSQKLEKMKKKDEKKNPEKEKTVELGWKHFREKDETYAHVPMQKGGGTRRVSVPLTSNRIDIMRLLKSTFFPNGKSFYGNAEEMEFALGTFQNTQMGVTLQIKGKEVPFTIGNYIDAYLLKNVRLYLLSKKVHSYSSDESDEEEDYLKSMIDTNNFTVESTESSDYGSKKADDECSVTKALIGTTEERESLKREQDKAYELSLQADMQKRIALEREKQEAEHKRKVQEARAARVPDEPERDFITVRVRHRALGICSYRFPPNSLMSAVYDWAGSLSPDILDFILCDPMGETLLPSKEVVDKCTLLMTSAPHTPSLNDDDDIVQFQGFGPASSNSNDKTIQDGAEMDTEHREEDIEM